MFFAVLLALLLLTSCGSPSLPSQAAGGAEKKSGAPGLPVRVANVLKQDISFDIRAIGNVEASSSVTVKSRIAGQIVAVHLRDGQDVRKGDLLFELDPEPFTERVRQAEASLAQNTALERQAVANVARDRAEARQARVQADRYVSLMEEGIASREQTDQARSIAEAAEASVTANEAAVESARAAIRAEEARLADAKLQLGYTQIAAPISGRSGAVAIKAGNLIKENDAALVTILQVTPIYVSFAVPEQSLPAIRRYMAANPVVVEATPNEADPFVARGKLDFIDSSVDTTTGTIRMRGSFENHTHQLWPGQFVNVTLRLAMERNVTVVPTAAVQSSQDGRYVWVIKPDSTAEMRSVEVSRTQGTAAVIMSGAKPGERVVIEGQLRLREGAKVDVLESMTALPPDPARRRQ